MQWQYIFVLFALFTISIVAIGLAYQAWRHRNASSVLIIEELKRQNLLLEILVAIARVTTGQPTRTNTLQNAEEIVLIHNAAKLVNDSTLETPSNQFREVLEINVVAPNTLNYFAIPYMQAGSSILYVGSTLSEKAVPGSFSYVTSKHAMVGMMRATCQDLAGRRIHTACVCPGFTDTEMLRQHVPEDVMEQISGMSAFERLVSPDEIANTLLWAAQSPVINGSIIHANLGQVER